MTEKEKQKTLKRNAVEPVNTSLATELQAVVNLHVDQSKVLPSFGIFAGENADYVRIFAATFKNGNSGLQKQCRKHYDTYYLEFVAFFS